MTERVALVVGATGMVGTRLVECLVSAGWRVIGLCQTPPTQSGSISYVSVNLLDGKECREKLKNTKEVTHIFYAARAQHGEGGIEPVSDNLSMLENILVGVSDNSRSFQHIHVVHGAKYYGAHLGRYPTPAMESDPRHLSANFYYDQQDYLLQRAGSWNWSISRPSLVYDYTPGRSRNPISLIAAYATISKALGLSLDYPGSEGSYKALVEAVSAAHLAKGIVWIATNEACINQAFNITNGDYFRWENIWPRFAEYFGLPMGGPRSISLSKMMVDKDSVWDRIVHDNKLTPTKLDHLALWPFGDFMFGSDWDLCSSTTKLRQTGFADFVDTEKMIFDLLDRYRSNNIIPYT